jgi:hypothetical protein
VIGVLRRLRGGVAVRRCFGALRVGGGIDTLLSRLRAGTRFAGAATLAGRYGCGCRGVMSVASKSVPLPLRLTRTCRTSATPTRPATRPKPRDPSGPSSPGPFVVGSARRRAAPSCRAAGPPGHRRIGPRTAAGPLAAEPPCCVEPAGRVAPPTCRAAEPPAAPSQRAAEPPSRRAAGGRASRAALSFRRPAGQAGAPSGAGPRTFAGEPRPTRRLAEPAAAKRSTGPGRVDAGRR